MALWVEQYLGVVVVVVGESVSASASFPPWPTAKEVEMPQGWGIRGLEPR